MRARLAAAAGALCVALAAVPLISLPIGESARADGSERAPVHGRSSLARSATSAGAGIAPSSLVPEFPTVTRSPFAFPDQDLATWRKHIPEIERVRIPSSADGEMQPALFYDPGGDAPKPLLVSLHSFSAGYLQNIDIPYAVAARRSGWVFIHPHFRGEFRRPESTASDLSLRDVVDAVQYAKRRANVDDSRIYLVGYSGGATTALALAASHPEHWAGVVAWVPIFDLVDWYRHARSTMPDRHYAAWVAASCGGRPSPGSDAEAECQRRSPSGRMRTPPDRFGVFIGSGIRDDLVPPSHSLRAFNALAAPEDRISERHVAHITEHGGLPEALRGGEGALDPLFEEAGTPPILERRSGAHTLALFDGEHEVVYNPGLAWLVAQRRRGPEAE